MLQLFSSPVSPASENLFLQLPASAQYGRIGKIKLDHTGNVSFIPVCPLSLGASLGLSLV